MGKGALFRGAKVKLRPVKASDLPKLVQWDADVEISGWAGKKFEREEDAVSWYLRAHPLQRRSYVIEVSPSERLSGYPPGCPSVPPSGCSSGDESMLPPGHASGCRIVGEIELMNISWRLHMGEMRILIGEKDLWGKGFGTDAVQTFVRGVFESTTLEEIFLRVDEENKRARRCYAKAGFRPQGRVTVTPSGEPPHSMVLMKIRKDDVPAD